MKKRNAAILTGLAGAALVAAAVFVIGSLGGCGGGVSAGAIAAIGAGSQQSNPDNPIFPIPPSHPGRIAFLSDRAPVNRSVIWAMNQNGGAATVVAKTKKFTGTSLDDESPFAQSREYTFLDPAISRDGFTVYYACDYFTTSTNIIRTGITNTAQVNVVKKDFNLAEPKVSWDGKTIAFVGYTTNPVTAITPEEKMKTTDATKSLLWLVESGWKMSTMLDAEMNDLNNSDYGILMIDALDLSECPAPNSQIPGGTATSTYQYDKEVVFSTNPGRYDFLNEQKESTYPLGQTICVNVDNYNFLAMEVTDYVYGFTKKPGYVCSTAKDQTCGMPSWCTDYKVCGFICMDKGLCLDSEGEFTTYMCDSDDDCGGETCDKVLHCLMDTGEPASITLKWRWLHETVSNKEVTNVELVNTDYDDNPDNYTITISDSINTAGTRTGSGVNLISSFDFKSYDLYTANIDGTNVVQQTTGAIAERYPCFSPLSSDVVYYTAAEASQAYQDVDNPIVSEIYMLDISTGRSERLFDIPAQKELADNNVTLVRHCSFNPSGSKMVFSGFNGQEQEYDLFIYDMKAREVVTQKLGTVGGDDLWPSFSPNGAYIAFQSDETNDNDIYTTDLTGTNVKNITNNRTVEDVEPAWGP